MNELIQDPLYLKGLINIASPKLVERYNATLSQLGLPPSKLKSFHIDGMGWSPEISEELKTHNYLSHGMANPMAIILSPDQRGKPLYAPFHSFDTHLLNRYFETFASEIADITQNDCIWLDLDQGLSHYSGPADLLLLTSVNVHSGSGTLTENAREQAALIKTFTEEPLAWFDPNLRERIIQHAKDHGDLRNRQLNLPDMPFEDVGSFYSHAFAGIFILKTKDYSYLVLEDEVAYKAVKTSFKSSFYLKDPELIEQLMGEGLLDVNVEDYQKNITYLRHKWTVLLADTLFKDDPELDLSSLSTPQRKQRLRALGEEAKPLFELEHLIATLESGKSAHASDLSPSLYRLLLYPHKHLKGHKLALIWQLLMRLTPLDVKQLYASDRLGFFAQYQTWSKQKKAWAKTLIEA